MRLTPVLAALLIAASAFAADKEVRNVIVIGWDAAQRNHVHELLASNSLPTLAALAKEGALVDMTVSCGATDTKAGWTQILTGLAPGKSGVFSNGRFQPVPVGCSVFERLEQHFGASNIATVAIVGKKGHVDAEPPQIIPFDTWVKREARQKKIDKAKPGLGNLKGGTIFESNGVKYVSTPGKPWFNACQRVDLWTNGLIENDKVGSLALAELEKRKGHRFFFFVHFAEPDHVGHRFGENSSEYSNGIISDDTWTGKIIAKLKELGLYDKTLIYVVADHGFNEGEKGHGYAPYVFVGTNDRKVNRNGDRLDVTPTVLKRFGVDLSTLQPALDGIPLDQPAPERPVVAPATAKKKNKKDTAK